MKYMIPLLLACFLFIACGAREDSELPSAVDLTPQAQQFVTKLSEGDYTGCVSEFDATMKSKLPEAKLEEVWKTIIDQVGAYEKQLDMRQTREGGYDVVYITCQFEKSKLDVKVVYNTDKEVTGLWFRPTK